VIHVSSFSKTISASMRCGYIAARADWIEGLADLKIATSFGGGRLTAGILFATLTDSGYRRHMETVRERLARAMEQTIARLAELGITPWLAPSAGMFVWCQLPAGMDAATLARACLEDGVVLAPGNVFSQAPGASGFLRFNVAQSQDEQVFTALARAMSGQG
jgi:DNA-binding transcriptional MocR family regulator